MKTLDLSGMGGGYEATCQKMLLNGLRYLKEHPDFDFSIYSSNPQVFGVVLGEGKSVDDMDKAISEGLEDITGAQRHAVLSHLGYIHNHGYGTWIGEGRKKGMRVYEVGSEEEIDKIISDELKAWREKLAGGYNPMAELLKKIPKENIIKVNSEDPRGMEKAAQRVAQIIKEEEGNAKPAG